MDRYTASEPAEKGGSGSNADEEALDIRGESTRRQWLSLSATTVGVGLAGCLGNGDDDDDDDDPNGVDDDPNGVDDDDDDVPSEAAQEAFDEVIDDLVLVHEGIELIRGEMVRVDINVVDIDEVESIAADERGRITDVEEALDGIDDEALQTQIDDARDVAAFQLEFIEGAEQFAEAIRQTQGAADLLEQSQFMEAGDAWEDAADQMRGLEDTLQFIENARAGLDNEFE